VNGARFSDSLSQWWRRQAKGAVAGSVTSASVAILGLAIIAVPKAAIAGPSDDSFMHGVSAYQRGQLSEALSYFRD
jgi:hypothetical protein